MTHRSPKHPQCSTGLATAIYTLSGSITAMIAAAVHTVNRRNEPTARLNPVRNSATDMPHAAKSTQPGATIESRCQTDRYSPIFRVNP